MMFERDDEIQWHGFPPPMNTPAQYWGRNPHAHDYVEDGHGACESDCPCCAWNKARALKQREDLGFPAKSYAPTADDMKFLADLKISWYGDDRKVLTR